mgnify:FL=1
MAHSREYTEQLTERRSARSFFLEEEEKLMDGFIEQSLDIFKYAVVRLRKTGEVFESRYLSMTTEMSQGRGGELNRMIGRCTKEFEAYCLLKKKVFRSLSRWITRRRSSLTSLGWSTRRTGCVQFLEPGERKKTR